MCQMRQVSPEDEAFERACAFWARHDLGDLAGVTHAQLELAAMLATEPNGSLGGARPASLFLDNQPIAGIPSRPNLEGHPASFSSTLDFFEIF